MFLCATKDFKWFLLFCWLMTLFGSIMFGNFATITDKISLIMQVHQQSFCCGKECGRGKRIEEKTSLPPWTKLTRMLMWIYIYYASNPDNHSYFIDILWRSISTLRNLKTYLRKTMVQDRLNGLALMHAHREMELDLEKIIDLFANLHPRRMRMENIWIILY